MGTDCVAVIAPVDDVKDERPGRRAQQQVAGALGLKVVYKRDLLARLRETHEPQELSLMEKAIDITRLGHEAAARATVAGVTERDVQTKIEYAFFSNGATGLSYAPSWAAARTAPSSTGTTTTGPLRAGDLVVIDAAADYGRYASDITRTYPVSGKFTDEQAKVYRAVYQAQEDIFAAIKPGVSMADLQKVAEASLKRAGLSGGLHPRVRPLRRPRRARRGALRPPAPRRAIFTVEPGVYLPERGFGVRIEDEVMVTETGYRHLSSKIPRKLEDVEAWVAAARR
jgi:Xaa-Pro aminopeptidase